MVKQMDLATARQLETIVYRLVDEDGGAPLAFCALDAHGDQVLASRQDGVKAASVDFALGKARTAKHFLLNTDEFGTFSSDPTSELGRVWVPADASLNLSRASVFPGFCGVAGGVLVHASFQPGVSMPADIIGFAAVSNRKPHEDHDIIWRAVEELRLNH